MAYPTTFSVKIYRNSDWLWCGEAPFGLSQYHYPDEVQEQIKQMNYLDDTCFELRNHQSASTTFQQVKLLLQEEHGIPLSIQSHFTHFPRAHPSDRGRPCREFADADTLGMAWEENDERKEGIVSVQLQTKANYLVSLGEDDIDRDSIVAAVIRWRHYTYALKYLRGKKNSVQEPNELAILESQIQEKETLANLWTQSATTKLSNWYELVHGHSQEIRETDIESRFRKWIKDRNEMLQRYRAEKRRKAPTQSNSFSPISTRPLRDESGQINPDYDGFTVRSGILLWGQLHTVFEGSRSEAFQRNAEFVPEMLPGGTIKQWRHTYRAAARKGRWNVRRAFTHLPRSRDGNPTRHLGWVVGHEDIDPLELLMRCSSIDAPDQALVGTAAFPMGETGRSLGNQHIDKDVLYINRYDWSHAHRAKPGFEDFVQLATGSTKAYQAGYMMALDAEEFSPDFVDGFSRDYQAGGMCRRDDVLACDDLPEPGRTRSPESRSFDEKIFMKPSLQHKLEGFGTYVSMKDTEYEFAWLVFSGRKHDDFDADELVAIVYDGVYDRLEGYNFAVEPGPAKSSSDEETSMSTEEHEDGHVLQAAIEKNDVELVKILLGRQGTETDGGSNWFGNALKSAVWMGNEDIVKILLEQCPTAETDLYGSALHAAAYGGHGDILDMLLDKGADVNARCDPYESALQAAAWGGSEKIVKRLFEKNADVNIEGGRFGHALVAAVCAMKKEVTEFLLENGANVNADGGQYFGHALHAAALLGNTQVLETLLDKGANIDAVGGQFGTALQAAAYRGNKEAVEILLRRGANIEAAENGEYGCALYAAVVASHNEILEILLNKGADLNPQHKKYKGALHAAMHQHNPKIVETLVAWGADIHVKCGPFTNALQAAIQMGRPAFMEIFIDHGAIVEGDIWSGNGAVNEVLVKKGFVKYW